MTLTAPKPSHTSSGLIFRALSLVYGTVVYTIFLGTFLYAIGFTSRFIVPKHVNSGGAVSPPYAIVTDLLLMSILAIQHSGMARKGFKRLLTGLVSPVLERSTYLLCSSLALIVLFTFWQPVRTVVWHIDNLALAFVVQLVSMLGWLLVVYSTFLVSHFELFGLKQVGMNFIGRPVPARSFRTPGAYRRVRHPLYLGFIIAVWATPTMTVGSLLFAAAATATIFIGIVLEERDLVATFGKQYRQYKTRVAMLLPGVF
jgi:protein-S-isoprenylcysteine O-methyltransferase Ste14